MSFCCDSNQYTQSCCRASHSAAGPDFRPLPLPHVQCTEDTLPLMCWGWFFLLPHCARVPAHALDKQCSETE